MSRSLAPLILLPYEEIPFVYISPYNIINELLGTARVRVVRFIILVFFIIDKILDT